MPTLFIGHGSPMNALANNMFTQTLVQLGKNLPQPKAVLCISAHWLSAGTWITSMAKPRTIHDFYGFPPELFAVQYPAVGDPKLAEAICQLIDKPKIQLDQSWGYDHGTWSILKHIYPQADIPVLQLSIDMSEPPRFHYELGQKLKVLRQQDVLIVGSGNIVHNLQQIRWKSNELPHHWAVEFDQQIKEHLIARDFGPLFYDLLQTPAGRLSVPTPDHYYPLLYILGASEEQDQLTFPFEGYELSSISLRCLNFQNKERNN